MDFRCLVFDLSLGHIMWETINSFVFLKRESTAGGENTSRCYEFGKQCEIPNEGLIFPQFSSSWREMKVVN